MHTFLHSIAQAMGWTVGLAATVIGVILLLTVLKRLTKKPMGGLSRKAQHRLFVAYFNRLERREQYEEMEEIRPLLLAYQDGSKLPAELLKDYEVKKRTQLKAKDEGLQLVTTRRIVRREE